ncbi:metal ABC transporter ATP-binding protein [Ruania albidiflava]|uniref:metal ABC transporter ATP-binding protein n=1 Tax=Ruania albidiflava TaxID=366586 RepID=UPI0023F4B825|nr:ABC transporter ATP-binding protein [Ruania albidiflava]
MNASNPAAARPAPGTPVIQAEHLSVAYDSARVLSDVDLTIRSGEAVALLGANGSGKSTLMRTLLGIIPATAGQARIFGTPVSKGRAVPWERIGYVPQRVAAPSGVPATAVEVVLTGLLNRRTLRLHRGARPRALAALEAVDLAGKAHTALQHLSGGQQQRVAIARALVRQPDLLLLDEPMAGVDTPTQNTLVKLLSQLHHDGMTIVVVLHEVAGMSAILQRAVVLRHGRIVHDGAPPLAADAHAGLGHQHLHADHGEEQTLAEEHLMQRSLP